MLASHLSELPVWSVGGVSIDTSVGRVEGVRVSIDTSVQVSGQGLPGLRECHAQCGVWGFVTAALSAESAPNVAVSRGQLPE